MFDFRLPDVGEGIHEAELVEWMVTVGDEVAEGDVVAVVNTDKVTVELPAPVGGTVTTLPWSPGDVIIVGDVLMTFDASDATMAPASQSTADTGVTVPSPTDGLRHVEPSPAMASHASDAMVSALARVIAAPSTRRVAAAMGIDLRGVRGSGPAGRILRSDLDRPAPSTERTAPAASPDPSSAPEAVGAEVVRERLGGVRLVVWRHMSQSSATLATTTSTFTVRMEAFESLIADLRAEPSPGDRARVGFLSLASTCVAQALRRHPRFNATFDPDTNDLLLHRSVNLGVAIDSPNGLVVPVLRRADGLRLAEIATSLDHLTAQARSGHLGVEDLRGGTFTLSSTGGLEQCRVTSTQPIVNLPQVALLWMSRIRDEPVVDDGQVRPGRLMSCSLSFDHRYLDGGEATRFINELTLNFERPLRVLV
jgi:pyruvate dehydrogenase E2 component (dihydrolipoamide acetyltransferase)